MDICDISDLVGIPLQFSNFFSYFEVYINIHDKLDQKIRLHSYGTLSRQSFITNFCTLMLSVAKIQIILKVYLFLFNILTLTLIFLKVQSK